MTLGNRTRGIIILLTANLVGGVLSDWTDLPLLLSYAIGAIVAVFVACTDLLWLAFCDWFWPSRLKRTAM